MDIQTSANQPTDLAPGSMPFYVNDPAESKTSTSNTEISKIEKKPPLILPAQLAQGVGSKLDSDNVDGFDAVSASTGGKNVLVATDNTGKLPTSVIPTVATFESSEQTLVLGAAISTSHGLNAIPKLVIASIRCKTIELGYSVGDEVVFMVSGNGSGTVGPCVFANSTTVGCSVGNGTPIVVNKSTGAEAAITLGNWKLVLRAWVTVGVGATGATGATGAAGPQGPTGAQGPAGDASNALLAILLGN